MDTTERGYLDQEFQLLESELNRIVEVTEYSGVKLINGDQSAGIDFQVGFSNSANDRISVSISSVNGNLLGLDDENLSSVTGAAAALSIGYGSPERFNCTCEPRCHTKPAHHDHQ